ERGQRAPLRNSVAYVLIAMGVSAAALGGLVSNVAATALPEAIRPFVIAYVVPLLVVVTALTIVLAIALYRLSAVLRVTPDNRTALLRKVQTRYTNRLQDALGEAARIDLGLREDPRAVISSALARRELSGHVGNLVGEEHALPPGTSIVTVYDDAQEELLILGEPGAGKTTLLVELAVTLVERAQKSKMLPMPIVFSLAPWANKRLPLGEWLAQELADTYQVPEKVAEAWVEAEELLPLLDGLDEVAEAHREACARAIDAYHRAHERVPLVVCCRSSEYVALQRRLPLQTAVVVQPL